MSADAISFCVNLHKTHDPWWNLFNQEWVAKLKCVESSLQLHGINYCGRITWSHEFKKKKIKLHISLRGGFECHLEATAAMVTHSSHEWNDCPWKKRVGNILFAVCFIIWSVYSNQITKNILRLHYFVQTLLRGRGVNPLHPQPTFVFTSIVRLTLVTCWVVQE